MLPCWQCTPVRAGVHTAAGVQPSAPPLAPARAQRWPHNSSTPRTRRPADMKIECIGISRADDGASAVLLDSAFSLGDFCLLSFI
ncbi:MAG: hypothetical protein EOO41_05640 [Methanobacteriota archaeon]|nr:MAG: hypothetical protein EOO41_05640 [Euryarchaeota archaeon]